MESVASIELECGSPVHEFSHLSPGTTEERQIYQRALRRVNSRLPRFARIASGGESQKDVKFELKKPADFNVGDTIQLYGVAKNQSFDRQLGVRVLFKVTSHTYAGTHEKVIKVVDYNEQLEPRDGKRRSPRMKKYERNCFESLNRESRLEEWLTKLNLKEPESFQPWSSKPW